MEKWLEAGKIEVTDLGRIYELLSAPLPQEGAQHADAKLTRKGYTTTGYKPQFFVNRMNEVCGLGGWRVMITNQTFEKITFGSGEGYEAVMTVQAQIGFSRCTAGIDSAFFVPLAERVSFGGQRARTPDDALKGALMAATSKVLSGFGVGKLAYEGGLDGALQDGVDVPPERKSQPSGATSPKQLIGDLTPAAKEGDTGVSALLQAQREFSKLAPDGVGLQVFMNCLAKFQASDIDSIHVSAIPNVRKVLLVAYEGLKDKAGDGETGKTILGNGKSGKDQKGVPDQAKA